MRKNGKNETGNEKSYEVKGLNDSENKCTQKVSSTRTGSQPHPCGRYGS